jgi:predicted AlkP superfamily phosphohydrolase/phosphomutase
MAAESERPKVVVIGLDGGTFDILQPLLQAGHMPHLQQLLASGSWGSLHSTLPPFTATAWSSFITGVNPGRHGVLSFTKRDSYNYDLLGQHFVDATQLGRSLWEIMSDYGRRVAVVNVPLTYPVRPVNGLMVSGMLTPPDARQFTYPPELVHTLGADYMIDVDFTWDGDKFRLHDLPPKEAMMAQIRHMTEVRGQVCERLMADEQWDFFMVVFTGTDRLFHFFWDDLAKMLNQRPSPFEEAILSYFQELDAIIGRLLARIDNETTVFVISDHGFGAAPTQRFYLNVWLEQLGLLRRRSVEKILDLEHWRVVVGRNQRLKQLLRKVLPQYIQDKSKNLAESVSSEIIHWSQTQAYGVPLYFHVCGVDINLAGERREGMVEESSEYELLREHIISEAKKLVNPVTGLPVVQIAARREELFEGDYVKEFPHVILVADPDYVGAFSLAGTALIEPHPRPMRPGEHRDDGIFVAAGPQLRCQGQLSGLKLLDVPATIMYAMQLPIPAHFDGRVISELFDRQLLAAHPPRYADDWLEGSGPGRALPEYSDEDEAAIKRRLRSLGYLE